MPETKLRTPSTAKPRMRKGKSTSHKNGYRMSASSASGQQTTSRTQKSKNFTTTSRLSYVRRTLSVPLPPIQDFGSEAAYGCKPLSYAVVALREADSYPFAKLRVRKDNKEEDQPYTFTQ